MKLFTLKLGITPKTKKHYRYFDLLINGVVPSSASSLDSSRMMVLLFCVNGIELIGKTCKQKEKICEWVYSRQSINGGFDGGPDAITPSIEAHLAMTYSALIILITLNDDLSRLNISKLIPWLKSMQDEDGSFRAVQYGSESDTRFIFSAAAICFLIQNWEGINVDKATGFILQCLNSIDGGFGLRPGLESHGGATYTSIAALSLLGKLAELTNSERLGIIRFCTSRQSAGTGGFNGRSNKDCDTCYAFWVGATLQILGHDGFINRPRLSTFLDTTFNPFIGGFGKTCTEFPDPLHSHFGVCARVLCRNNSSSILEASLGMSLAAFRSHFKSGTKTASGTRYT